MNFIQLIKAVEYAAYFNRFIHYESKYGNLTSKLLNRENWLYLHERFDWCK